MKFSVHEVMERSGVRFGTSGARGLVADLTDLVAYTCTRGFLQYLQASGELTTGGEVAVGGDLRASTPRIMDAVCRAAEDFGSRPVTCGRIPSPALALHGLTHRIPALMVTGSHIPDDRNGIKFNKISGEILKEDEAGVREQWVEVPEALFDRAGAFAQPRGLARPTNTEAREAYVQRYLDFFPADALRGVRLGVYQHSAVGRELLVEILSGLGAETTRLGFSEVFVPVDTEAIRSEDVRLARDWSADRRFDAIVSTDGDGDRPLMADERGGWLRGDVVGILCARFLEADSVSTPVSCNTAVEKCCWFGEVRRTRIGSPYVVASMIEAAARGARRVVGYEANGGFFIHSEIECGGRVLPALPTRDAMILVIGVLVLAQRERRRLSALVASLPARYTASDRLQAFAPERSAAILARFTPGTEASARCALEVVFGPILGRVAAIDRTDGLRVTFESGEIIHLRPSGNAPEFRCYSEATSPERAAELNKVCLNVVAGLG
jgi:phosphomannomutase